MNDCKGGSSSSSAEGAREGLRRLDGMIEAKGGLRCDAVDLGRLLDSVVREGV